MDQQKHISSPRRSGILAKIVRYAPVSISQSQAVLETVNKPPQTPPPPPPPKTTPPPHTPCQLDPPKLLVTRMS
jgi:hypothetical protein